MENTMENTMENCLLNNKYLHYANEDYNNLSKYGFDIDENTNKMAIIEKIYKYFIKTCEEKIFIENKEDFNDTDDGYYNKYFHLFFENYDDMIMYNVFVEMFVKYINKKINKDLVCSGCDCGKSKYHDYSIRIDVIR